MRRLLPIAAFALALAVPLWAQHGGGHAGGHAGGFGGHGFGGHIGSPGHISGGMHSTPSRGFNRTPSFSQRGFSHRGFGNDGFRHHRIHTFGFRNSCFGFRCRGFGYGYRYPWGYAGYYDPYWWDSSSSYDEDYERDRAIANEMNQQSLEEQRVREQEERDGDQDLYARSAPPAAPATEAQPSTVLVFRDQHQKEVRNYAIVGRTLINFAAQRTEKIPLADLDLTATAKANDDRGLTFRLPSSGEGQ